MDVSGREKVGCGAKPFAGIWDAPPKGADLVRRAAGKPIILVGLSDGVNVRFFEPNGTSVVK